jgi:DNA-binding response OmpR family regulator
MRILFVENHQLFAETVVAQFLADHVVVIVPSVSAAIEAVRRTSFDVVLLDYDLDNEKGDVLLTRFRSDTCSVPVVAVSARLEGNEALVRAGAVAVCSKGDFSRIGEVLANL